MPDEVLTKVPSLAEADEIGQLVLGTSADARYVCVALGKTANMAVRLTGYGDGPNVHITLSVRVESKGDALNEALIWEAAGLSVKGKYASAHLKSDTPFKAIMGVAAYIALFHYLLGGKSMAITTLKGLLGQGH